MDNIEKYWAQMHSISSVRYLSGSSGRCTWDECGVTPFIKKGKNILNIGVGLGYCTRDLYDTGANVYVLDICEEAINRVEKFIIKGYLEKDIESIPDNFFDLAISHLVTQHMSDEKTGESNQACN